MSQNDYDNKIVKLYMCVCLLGTFETSYLHIKMRDDDWVYHYYAAGIHTCMNYHF